MLGDLKIWQKFTLIAVAFSLPIIALSYFLTLETNKTIEFTRTELEGTQVLRPLRKLAVDTAAHRDLAGAVLAGDVAFKADLDKRGNMIEADLNTLLINKVVNGTGEVLSVKEYFAAATLPLEAANRL